MKKYDLNVLISEKQDKIIEIINSLEIECDVVRRKENYGLVKSVLTTVKEGLSNNDHIVLLEDDCLPDEQFFDFMSMSLSKHHDDKLVSSVCGTVTKCAFNPWGWATWAHKWRYEHLSKEEMLGISNLDMDLRKFLENNNVEDSIWSLSWLAYQYKNSCTAVFPCKNLIKNIGINDSGVHSHEKGYTNWLLSQI